MDFSHKEEKKLWNYSHFIACLKRSGKHRLQLISASGLIRRYSNEAHHSAQAADEMFYIAF
jgi:hypothetical protein